MERKKVKQQYKESDTISWEDNKNMEYHMNWKIRSFKR